MGLGVLLLSIADTFLSADAQQVRNKRPLEVRS